MPPPAPEARAPSTVARLPPSLLGPRCAQPVNNSEWGTSAPTADVQVGARGSSPMVATARPQPGLSDPAPFTPHPLARWTRTSREGAVVAVVAAGAAVV